MKDAIIILAGGVNDDGSLPADAKHRVEKGAELWKAGVAPRLVMTGKYGFWLDWTKKVPKIFEASAMKRYAASLGVPETAIITEEDSKDTIGNAYFTKANILEKNGWKSVAVVTSDYHMERTRLTFDAIFGSGYSIEYVPVDSGLTPEAALKWKASEAVTIGVLKRFMADIAPGDMKAIERMLYEKHPGYSANPEFSFEKLKAMLGRDVRRID